MFKINGKTIIPIQIWMLLIIGVTILTAFAVFTSDTKEAQAIVPSNTTATTTPTTIVSPIVEDTDIQEVDSSDEDEEPFSQTDKELESEEVALTITNEIRTNLGLGELARNEDFDLYAKLWAEEMASINQPFSSDFFHSPHFIESNMEFIELPMYEPNWQLVNENVGRVTRVPESEESLSFMIALYGEGEAPESGFLASISHKCSLINPYATETGIGVHIEGQSVYIAQLFVQYGENGEVIRDECLEWWEQIQGQGQG